MNLKKVNSAHAIVLTWLVVAILASCAKSPYINVDYSLPEYQTMTPGNTVVIQSSDLREDMAIFNDKAQKKFADFSGQFYLYIREPNSQPAPLGNYDLPHLFETAFDHRLKKLGVPVTDQPSPKTLELHIDINRFYISLVGNKWLADIGYKASLMKNGKRIATETVTGSAERPKIAGRGGAEKVIGEIFTDVINQLDIERLFSAHP